MRELKLFKDGEFEMDIKPGAFLILPNTQGEILAVLNNRDPARWDLSGGEIEIGPEENPDSCLSRELHEELGLYIPPNELVLVGRFGNIQPTYLFTPEERVIQDWSPSHFRLQKNEVREVRFVDPKSIRDMKEVWSGGHWKMIGWWLHYYRDVPRKKPLFDHWKNSVRNPWPLTL